MANKLSRYVRSLQFCWVPAFFFCTTIAFAGSRQYECEVIDTRATEISTGKIDDGTLTRHFVGKKFFVDRATGIVIEPSSDIFPHVQPIVVAKGSEENFFRIVWEIRDKGKGGGVFPLMLRIEEALQADRKPFQHLTSWGMLVTGLCD